MKLHVVLCFMTTVALSACVTQPKLVPQSERFDAEAARAQLRPGTGSVDGSALIRQSGGGVVTCAGVRVSLFPDNAYARERMSIIFGSTDSGFYRLANVGKNSQPAGSDPDYMAIIREAVCDPQGKFSFSNLAPGSYFITTSVVWQIPGRVFPEGGHLMRRVELSDGESTSVVLTP